MKKHFFGMAALVLFCLSLAACNTQNKGKDNSRQEVAEAENIKVMYFHFSRRCATCKAVESESQEALKELYAEQMKNGKVVFESVNLDREEGKETGSKYGIESQSLVVISGSEQTDLTTEAFMNARTKPEKLKKLIQESVEAYL